jgi:YVTN family beta-propeller protein
MLVVEVYFEECIYMGIKCLNTISIRPIIGFSVALSVLLATVTIVFTTELTAATPTPEHPFHVENQWNVGGNGGWSFLNLDASTHQLYIPRTNHVMVVDTVTGKVSGEVEGLMNVRDIALDDSGRYGYITDVTDGTAGFVRVFDRSTLKVVTSVSTGQIPYTIVFDPVSKSVMVFNSRGRSITVIDSTTNEVLATISLSGRPGNAVADGKGGVFAVLPALDEITRVDALAKKATVSWQLTPCTGPVGLAIDKARRQLFTVCEDHKLVAINADTGRVTVISDVPANSGDIGFDSKHDMLFLADASGTLTIFHCDSAGKYSRLQTVKTQPGARIMTVSQQDGKAYLVTSKFAQDTGAVSEELRFRPTPVPGSFCIIVVGR